MHDPVKFRSDLVWRANWAHAYHDIWAAIGGKGLLPYYAGKLNEYCYLAKSVELGLQQAFIVTLCSLYDTDAKAISIQRYADHLCNRGKSDPQWQREFRVVRKQAARLFKLRNKYFAHDSEDKYGKNFWKEAAFTRNELSGLMKTTWDLLARLVYLDDQTKMTYRCDPKPDIRRLFPRFDASKTWA
jgi:hypothetical protein